MPWCDDCSRFWNPNSMGAAGECPTCGRVLVGADAAAAKPAPWHFKLLVLAVVAYLGVRAWQGVEWLITRW